MLANRSFLGADRYIWPYILPAYREFADIHRILVSEDPRSKVKVNMTIRGSEKQD